MRKLLVYLFLPLLVGGMQEAVANDRMMPKCPALGSDTINVVVSEEAHAAELSKKEESPSPLHENEGEGAKKNALPGAEQREKTTAQEEREKELKFIADYAAFVLKLEEQAKQLQGMEEQLKEARNKLAISEEQLKEMKGQLGNCTKELRELSDQWLEKNKALTQSLPQETKDNYNGFVRRLDALHDRYKPKTTRKKTNK